MKGSRDEIPCRGLGRIAQGLMLVHMGVLSTPKLDFTEISIHLFALL